jgi:DNA helicase IV
VLLEIIILAIGGKLLIDNITKPERAKHLEYSRKDVVSKSVLTTSGIKPTIEQKEILEALENLDMISTNAFAGTGKTTTLGLIVERYKDKRIMVLAFNRAMAKELKEKFRDLTNVEVYTTHGLAYKYVQKELGIKNIESERALPKFINEQLMIKDFSYAAFQGKLLVDYCRSAETNINASIVFNLIKGNHELYAHYNYGLKDNNLQKIANDLREVYEKAIEQNKIFHDLYLKYFQLNIEKFLPLFKDYFGLLLDEAQDTSPVTFDLFMKIPAVKKVIVGDKHQNIFSWRGARNYLSNSNFRIFYLTETFRFGENIANAANKILKDYKGETNSIKPSLRIKKGNGKIAYITRTNSKIIELISNTQEKVAFLRSLDDIFRPVFYAREAIHYYIYGKFYNFIELPEYLIVLIKNFKTIVEFENYCSTFDREMYVAIQIANRYYDNIGNLWKRAKSLYDREAKVVFATAHTTKGLEFEKVIIEGDFPKLEELIYKYALEESKKEIEEIEESKLKTDWVPDFPEIFLKNVEKIRKAIKEDDQNYSTLINDINLKYVAITRAQREISYNNLTEEKEGIVKEYIKQLEIHYYNEKAKKKYAIEQTKIETGKNKKSKHEIQQIKFQIEESKKSKSTKNISLKEQCKMLERIYPGCKLYHRANYFYDKSNSFGEITVKKVKGDYIVFDTLQGEKIFHYSAIGKNLFFSESDVTKNIIIDGEMEIPENELKKYIRNKRDYVFIKEKSFFLDIQSKLHMEYEEISKQLRLVKYEFNDYFSAPNPYCHYNDLYKEQKKLLDAINRPYFARLDLSNYADKTIYIGDRALFVGDKRIYDWREPVCEVYYVQNPVLYEKYGLELIRKLDIYKGVFCGYFDSYVKEDKNENQPEILDDFLISIIKKQRENKVNHDIIQTITSIQYTIISEELNKNLIIQGCAGSGKTMVLMHRLSHLLYNNKNLSPTRIKIITPNKNLNLELTQLAKKLQLSDVPRYTFDEYYLYLIREYYKSNKIFQNAISEIIGYDADLLEEDENLDEKTLNNFASEYLQFEKNQKELAILCNWGKKFILEKEFITCDDRIRFLEYFDSKFVELCCILKDIKIILRNTEKLNLVSELNKREKGLKREGNKLKKDIDKALEKLSSFKEEYKNGPKSKDTCDAINRLSNIKKFMENGKIYDNIRILRIPEELEKFLREHNYFGMHKKKDEVSLFRSFTKKLKDRKKIFDQLQYINIYMQSLNSNNRKVSNIEVENFINDFNNFESTVNLLRDFIEQKNIKYFNFIWRSFIEQIKKNYNIPLNKKYQFEVFALLEVLYAKFGELTTSDQYLFIDEGQDLLEKELMLILNINNNNNLYVNIFGDKFQRTRKVEDRYFFDNLQNDKFKTYELNVNYRNCIQISEYINKRCDTKIKFIGIDGVINLVKFNNLSSEIFSDLINKIQGKKVLIVKNEEALQKLKKKLNWTDLSHVNRIFDSRNTFSDVKLNILNIKSSKGLEFSEAVIFDYKLTKNELYIACSRALERLTVIEYDDV